MKGIFSQDYRQSNNQVTEPFPELPKMSLRTDNPSILGLAEDILEKAKNITKYLQANDLAAPTFSSGASSPPSNAEFRQLQGGLRDCLEDLQRLVDGPTLFYRHFLMRGYELAAFQVALDFDFFTAVPAKGEISLDELARNVGLDQDRTSRLIRLLITHRFFQEHKPGYVSHNSFSAALLDEEVRAMVHYS